MGVVVFIILSGYLGCCRLLIVIRPIAVLPRMEINIITYILLLRAVMILIVNPMSMPDYRLSILIIQNIAYLFTASYIMPVLKHLVLHVYAVVDS